MAKLWGVVLQGINLLGLLFALPALIAAGFSFDHAASPPHWAHLAFVFGLLAFPSLSLIGLLSKPQRYFGLIGLMLALAGNVLMKAVCHGVFRCHT